MASLVGSRVERKEDKKLLTGRGKYTADVNFIHQTYAYFVRSPHARAEIKKVDISKASKAPGVVAVLTGADIANDKIGGLIAGWRIKSEDGSDMKVPAHPPLANESVNYVGDHVAVVIAESLDEARSAADLVKVDYKILKAVVKTKDAMDSDQIYKDIPKNMCFDWLLGDRAKVKEAFEKADKVIKIDIINNMKDVGSNQNEILFILGKAISGAPIIIGTNQLPNPPIIAGITIKNIMIKP